MGVTDLWIGVIVGGLPLLGFVLWWWNELWYVVLRGRDGNRLPPGHLGLPFIGDTFTFIWYFKFLRRPDDYINTKRHKYGEGEGLFRTHLFGTPSIIACEPLVSKFVLQSSDDKFISEWPTYDLVGHSSMAAVQGKEHARMRSFVINAVNRPDALRCIALLVQPRVVVALQSWAHKGRINAYLETKKVTLENIGKLFGSFEPGDLLDTMDGLFQGLLNGMKSYPLDFPGTAHRHGLKCKKKLDEIFGMELQKRKKRKLEDTVDLMDGLMQVKDDEGNGLSDAEILDNIVGLVVGGYVSTALVSMWAIYFLAKFPNVLHKLREENNALKKAKTTGDFITTEEISKLKYTNMVVEETLRMGNVAIWAFRSTVKEVEYKGYKLPKGWRVIVWLRHLHTDPKNFEDPMCFNPERWNEPAKPGTYQVFGGGRRICAGNMLARLQLGILLHHLSTGYKWELVNPEAGMVCLPHQKPEDGVEVLFSKL